MFPEEETRSWELIMEELWKYRIRGRRQTNPLRSWFKYPDVSWQMNHHTNTTWTSFFCISAYLSSTLHWPISTPNSHKDSQDMCGSHQEWSLSFFVLSTSAWKDENCHHRQKSLLANAADTEKMDPRHLSLDQAVPEAHETHQILMWVNRFSFSYSQLRLNFLPFELVRDILVSNTYLTYLFKALVLGHSTYRTYPMTNIDEYT